MFNFLKILTKRPSDNFIRISKVVFGLIIILSIYYNLIYLNKEIDSSYFGYSVTEDKNIYIKYSIAFMGLIPLIMGALNICLLKSKYIRILQIIFGVLLFYISSIIKDNIVMDIDILILIMGFFPLIAGITGKCITKKCLRHKEKITKIRV